MSQCGVLMDSQATGVLTLGNLHGEVRTPPAVCRPFARASEHPAIVNPQNELNSPRESGPRTYGSTAPTAVRRRVRSSSVAGWMLAQRIEVSV